MLIVRARDNDSSDNENNDLNDNDNEESGFSMASVTGAMYLLVASTTPDLRAGFTLLVDGLRYYQRVFGAVLLTLYGLMICAAMKVLFSTSNDDASVVINAVTVLFIADVVSGRIHIVSLVSSYAMLVIVWLSLQRGCPQVLGVCQEVVDMCLRAGRIHILGM